MFDIGDIIQNKTTNLWYKVLKIEMNPITPAQKALRITTPTTIFYLEDCETGRTKRENKLIMFQYQG